MKNALLACCFIAGGWTGYSAEPPAPSPQPPPPRSLPVILAQTRVDAASIESVYNEAILRDGSIDSVVRQLSAFAEDKTQSAHFRGNALLVASHLQWRFGRLTAATETVDRAIAIESTGELSLQKARLLEATGNLTDARRYYEQTLSLMSDPEDKEDVRLRLIFMATDTQNVEALVSLAKTRDREFRNRAAVALAILNRPAEAADLYEAFGEGPKRQRQHLRLAQWALQAGNAPKAQEEAWQATLGSSLSRDLRYSLSILVEAHDLDDTWDRLLAKLESHPNPGPDVESVRGDILRRLRRYDEAIALVEKGQRDGITPEGQRRLLRMYSEAGRAGEMVSEFRKLIAKEPAELTWPSGLSEHYMEQGRRDDAERVWRAFIDRNSKADVLLEGGQIMARFGLDELALAAADKCLAARPESAVNVMWYRFEHYLKRGQMPKAEEMLSALDKDLPPDSPSRADLAEAYERIKNPQRAVAVWEALDKQQGGLGVEEKMRLAWLYDTVGKRDRALAMWKKLWDGEIPESRRKLVEDRLLLLAAETAGLGDIAIEIEQKLAKGTAAAKDSSLLVRIYTEVGDSASAIEVIQEYFGRRERTAEAEIASLKEQARVYQTLNKHVAFGKVTEKLLTLDPTNKTDYLQSLILGQLERGAKPDAEQLQRRLSELRQTNVTADEEFEAGVLVMANMKDKAIDTYRRALARNPGHSDNYLLLADLLKQNKRQDEGIAILQYFAEIAPGDDGFMVAIDGILNLKPAPESAVLRWAQRRVLERITRHDDKFYLYDLSAELSEEARDMKSYVSALENALVDAGPRRTTVLRQLISTTEEKNMMMSMGQPALPDLNRNLAFSRRLIALGEEMPPEVYLNVGRAFLKMENPAEALEAFNLAIDRTNRQSLVEESADRFDSAGYGEQAMLLYQKALINDVGSISLMSKLAQLRSRGGSVKVANDMYARALLALAAQQLVEVDTGATKTARRGPTTPDDNFTYVYKKHFWPLQTGLLFTLSGEKPAGAEDPGAMALVDSAISQALQDVLRRAGGKVTRPLENYPRLNLLARLGRQLAMHNGDYAAADRNDLNLLRHFGSDAKLVMELVNQRVAWGLYASAETIRTGEGVSTKIQGDLAGKTGAPVVLAQFTDLTAAARQALSDKNYEVAAETALAADDPAMAFAAYQEWIRSRKETSSRRGGAAGAMVARTSAATPMVMLGAATLGGGTSSLAQIASRARHKLDPKQYAALCQQIAAVVAEDQDAARELLLSGTSSDMMRGSPEKSTLRGIEEAIGKKLFTEAQLTAAIAGIDPRRMMSLDMDYVLNSVSAAERGPAFLRYVQAVPATFPPTPIIAVLRNLLTQPIDADSAGKIAAAMKSRFQQVSKNPYGLRYLSSSLAALGKVTTALHPDNAAFMNDLDRELTSAYPDAFGGRSFKSWVTRDSETKAKVVAEVVDSAFREFSSSDPNLAGMPTTSRMRMYFSQMTETLYPDNKVELLALLDKKLTEMGPTPAVFAISLAALQSDPNSTPQNVAAWLEGFLKRYPDNKLGLEALFPVYAQLGEFDKERATLERLIVIAPATETYRARLAAIWRALDHPENTLKALGGNAREASPRSTSRTSRATPINRPGETRSPQISKYIARITESSDPKDARAGLRGLLQLLPASGGGQRDYFQMMMGEVAFIDFGSLFELNWDRPASRARGNDEAPWMKWLESDVAERGQSKKLLDRLTTQPFALAEFEAMVRTLDPSATDTDNQYLFYPLLADAYASNGRAVSEFERLTKIVNAGAAGKKEALLWMELASRQPAERVREVTPIAEKLLQESGPIGEYQRIQLARVYARGGQRERAVGVYSVAAVAGMSVSGYRYSRSERLALFTAVSLCEDASEHLDAEGMALLVTRFLNITKPQANSNNEQWHRRFAIWLMERALKSGVPSERIQAIFGSVDTTGARQEDLFRYAGIQSRVLPVEQALPALRHAFAKPSESPQDMYSRGRALDLNNSRYPMNLGLQRMNMFSPSLGETNLATMLKDIVPTRVDAWPGAREWIVRAAQAIPGWISRGEVAADVALQSLALFTYREHQLGMAEAADSAKELSRLLGTADGISTSTASLVVAVTEAINSPIDLGVAKKLVEKRRVDVRQIAGLIHRLAETEGASAAIAVGESALNYTQNDTLLREMETLAQQSGNAAQVERFKTIRQQAATARAALESGKRGSAPERFSSVN